jgi:hypothetical protein
MPFAVMQMELEDITLHEIRQTWKDNFLIHMWRLKMLILKKFSID